MRVMLHVDAAQPVTQIEFKGTRLDTTSVPDWRRRVLGVAADQRA